MAVTEASRIAAAGIPLNLGGREVRVRYTLRSWKEAEDQFGSMEKALETLRGLLAGTEPKPVGATMTLLWCGLQHEGLSLDDVYELGDVDAVVNVYAKAVLAAVSEGTSAPGSGKGDGEAASPGPTTTTPSPSDTPAAMASSGV